MKNRQTLLIDFINQIRADKALISIDIFRDINKYYKFKFQMFDECNIVDFIKQLSVLPVGEYIEDIENTEPLLDKDGSLNPFWEEWYVNAVAINLNDQDKKFDDFRKNCFNLQKEDKEQAHDLYEITRRFIIENPIVDREELDYIFMNKRMPAMYKKYAIEYLKDCYEFIRTSREIEVCDKCGYVKTFEDKEIIHRLCNSTFSTRAVPRGTYLAKPGIFTSIVQPGLFEIEVYQALLDAGFQARLFPDIEKEGDVEVIINREPLYLDMKSYFVNNHLYEELTKNGFLKDKYKNRWIVVPSKYYADQKRELQSLLNRNGSRIYDIEDLIAKLKRMESAKNES